MIGEAWTVESFLMRSVVEIPGGVYILGWDLDRGWDLVRTTGDADIGDACPTFARRPNTMDASEGDLDI